MKSTQIISTPKTNASRIIYLIVLIASIIIGVIIIPTFVTQFLLSMHH